MNGAYTDFGNFIFMNSEALGALRTSAATQQIARQGGDTVLMMGSTVPHLITRTHGCQSNTISLPQ
jgi:hypothetical protein